MKKKIDRSRLMKSSLVAVPSFALFVLGVLAPACAADAPDGKSGETHFLCKSDDDCTRRLGDAYVCSASYCALASDAGSGSSAGGGQGAAGTAGATGMAGVSGGAGMVGVGGRPGGGGTGGGDFSACETPPPSDCSFADTCANLGCGSLQYDEHACLRSTCESDADCAAEERCAWSSCEVSLACTQGPSGCECGGPELPCSADNRCNPVALAGPRGTWVTLDVTRASGPCPTVGGCTSTWHVAPDGHVTGVAENTPVDTSLTSEQLFDFNNYVNGPSLRTALRDGLPCMDEMITDVDLTVTLKLSTETLSKHANRCFATDNVLAKIYEVLSKL